ncbi:MAG: universal stress protein [Halobacteriaceae archaeon]
MTMSERHYLVGYDRSAESDDALRYAVRMAADCGARVTVATAVAPEVETVAGERVLEDLEDAEARAATLLDDAHEVAASEDADVSVRTEMLYGDPADALASFVEAEGVDAVYVGHRGLSPRREALLGSVAKSAIERIPVPVTVV